MKQSIILRNLDILYVVIIAIAITLQMIFPSEVLETVTYILVLVGCAFSVFPRRRNSKDERLVYIKHITGYFTFFAIVLVIMVFSILDQYFSIEIEATVVIRSIGMITFFVFTAVNAVAKRMV